ncbi:MAG: GspH/FimT family pseudopilin [Burkholderiaceae bacterium]
MGQQLNRWGRPGRVRGFTLIELMVVLVVIGVALAMVSVNGLPGSREGLRFETERLAQLLVLAREEAQVRGAPIRLDIDDRRYRFLVLRNREWQPLLDDAMLRERLWEASTRVGLNRVDGRPTIEFGREAVDSPFVLSLARDTAQHAILANGLGTFEVQ